jgi:hypothetical protein
LTGGRDSRGSKGRGFFLKTLLVSTIEVIVRIVMDKEDRKKYSSLSKSRFMNGLQCPKRLYLETWHRELASPPSPALQRIFDTGHRVGELACKRYPEGILVEGDFRQPERALEHTRKLLDQGATVLFEPAFLFDGIFVRVDIFQKREDGTWNIIEVKSNINTSETHIADSSVQRYVVEGSGLPVSGVYLMHLNRLCRYPDLDNLFAVDDITEATEESWKSLFPKVEEFLAILQLPEAPDITIGKQCSKPYECNFKEYCWKGVEEPSIFSIPRISAKRIAELTGKGIYSVHDIPADFPLSENQRRYAGLFEQEKPQILWPAIRDELASLSWPLYFLDFETQMDAVPRLSGLRPYDQYPFQYSLHILEEDGKLSHREYLHFNETDPRLPLAAQLCQDIGPEGTIVAYNDSFERRIIKDLTYVATEYQALLWDMPGRFFDLLKIFRDYYFHPAFGGSASIKAILPVLVPELSYKELEVQNGGSAQVVWDELIREEDRSKRLSLAQGLKAYCHLDTLAMVRLYQHLTEGGRVP